jgi:hypothetical protein
MASHDRIYRGRLWVDGARDSGHSFLLNHLPEHSSKVVRVRLVSCPADHPLLNLLRQRPGPTHFEAVAQIDDFVLRVNASCAEEANSYGLQAEQIDKIVLLTNTRFRDNYYYVGCPTWAIIALGGWQNELAPPSIVEYYLSILTTSALDALGAGIERHYLTPGCNFDFNASPWSQATLGVIR